MPQDDEEHKRPNKESKRKKDKKGQQTVIKEGLGDDEERGAQEAEKT